MHSTSNPYIVTPAKEDMFLVHFVGWSASKQDCAKPTDPSDMKLGARVQHGPRKNPINFGEEVSHINQANP